MNTRHAIHRPSPIRRRRLRRIATIAAVGALPFAATLPGGTDIVEADAADTVTPLFDSGLVVHNSSVAPLFDSGLVVQNSAGSTQKEAGHSSTAMPIAGSPLVVRG